MYSQPRFGLITPQQVTGFLKATASVDPDVLAAAKDQIAGPYRPLKWFGIWGMVVGVLCCLLIVLAFIGIPIFIFGVWAFRRAKKNAATIDAAFDAYVASVAGGAPASAPVSGPASAPAPVPGEIRAVVVALAGGLALASLLGAPGRLSAQTVPEEFQGDWVDAAASCDAPLRMRVETETVTLINDADTASFEGIQMAGPGFWGPDYTGIQAQMITDFDGDQPVTVTFNYEEDAGVAMADYSFLEGQVNPAYAPMQERLKQLDLAGRFPLKGVALKECPVEGT